MTILVLVSSLIAGMLIAEYYNRRIQKIMRESWQEAENARRRRNWQPVYYDDRDYERVRRNERAVKPRG